MGLKILVEVDSYHLKLNFIAIKMEHEGSEEINFYFFFFFFEFLLPCQIYKYLFQNGPTFTNTEYPP